MPPSLEPQQVSEGVWYYETRRRIEVMHEIMDSEGRIRTVMVTIPLGMLKKSLQRIARKG